MTCSAGGSHAASAHAASRSDAPGTRPEFDRRGQVVRVGRPAAGQDSVRQRRLPHLGQHGAACAGGQAGGQLGSQTGRPGRRTGRRRRPPRRRRGRWRSGPGGAAGSDGDARRAWAPARASTSCASSAAENDVGDGLGPRAVGECKAVAQEGAERPGAPLGARSGWRPGRPRRGVSARPSQLLQPRAQVVLVQRARLVRRRGAGDDDAGPAAVDRLESRRAPARRGAVGASAPRSAARVTPGRVRRGPPAGP